MRRDLVRGVGSDCRVFMVRILLFGSNYNDKYANCRMAYWCNCSFTDVNVFNSYNRSIVWLVSVGMNEML